MKYTKIYYLLLRPAYTVLSAIYNVSAHQQQLDFLTNFCIANANYELSLNGPLTVTVLSCGHLAFTGTSKKSYRDMTANGKLCHVGDPALNGHFRTKL